MYGSGRTYTYVHTMYYKTDACTLIGLVIAHFVTNEAWWWEMSTKLLLHVPNQNSRPPSLLRNWNLQHGSEPNEQSSAIRRWTKPSPSISWARITRKFLGFDIGRAVGPRQGFKGPPQIYDCFEGNIFSFKWPPINAGPIEFFGPSAGPSDRVHLPKLDETLAKKCEILYTHSSKFCALCAMQKDFHQVLNIRMMERNGYAVQKNSHSMRFDDMTLYKVIDDLMLD